MFYYNLPNVFDVKTVLRW